MAALVEAANDAIVSGALESTLTTAVNATVLETSAVRIESPVYTTTSTSEESSETNIGLIAGVTVAGIAVMVALASLGVYMFRRRAKVTGEISSEDTISHDNEKDKPSMISVGSGHESNAIHSNIKIKKNKVEVEDIEAFE